MTPRIALGPFGAMLAAVAIALALQVVAPDRSVADDEPRAPGGKIDRILVPGDRPDLWPQGDWRPLPSVEFEAFLRQQQQQSHSEFEGPIIERAEYSAIYLDHTLRDGRLTWSLAHSGKRAELLTLAPFNLALAPKLRGPDAQTALWGTAADGQTRLLVRPGRTQVQGDWGIGGRRLSTATEFDIEIPAAQISQLRLALLENQRLKSSVGIVSGPLPQSQSGWNEWRINLGAESKFRVTVSQIEESRPGSPTILATRDVQYVIHEGGCAVRTDFLLEVPDAPVKSIRVSIPTDVQIHRVTYGDGEEVPLPWSTTEEDRALTVTLPDPLHGRSRAIGVHASSDVIPDALHPLPQIVLQDAAFAGGRLQVDVRRPLELKTFEPTGCRQLAASFDVPNRESFTFDQFAADAQLHVEVGYPRLDLTSRQINLISVEPQNRSLTSEIEWRATSGSTFEVFCSILPGWEIVDVQALAGSKLTSWELKQPLAEKHLLVLEFLNALESGRPKRVQLIARQLSGDSTDPLNVPPIEPLGCTSAGMVLGVSRSESTRPLARPYAAFEPWDPQNQPDILPESELWQAFDATPERTTAVYVSTSPNPTGVLSFEETRALAVARAEVKLQVSPQRIREQYRVDLQPRAETPVQRLFVYLTAAGEGVAWQLEGEEQTSLTAKRAPDSKSREWNLPSAGELWELRLPSPQESKFVITGHRTHAISQRTVPALLLVPETREFQGVVELMPEAGIAVNVDTTDLQPETRQFAAENAASGDPIGETSRWTYQKASDSLALEIDVQTATAGLRNAAFLELYSVLHVDGAGFDVHRATFKVLQPSRSRLFSFRLAESAELLEVQLNDRRIIPNARGLDYELPQLPEQSSNLIRIDYRTPIDARSANRNVIVPRSSWDVLEFDWRFALPPGLSPSVLPGDLLLANPLPRLTWSQHIFGPLGRQADGSWFNLFSGTTWRRLFDSNVERASQHELVGFAPVEWTVHRATAPRPPQTLAITIQDRNRSELIAWIGLFGALVAVLFIRKFGLSLSPVFRAAWLCLLLVCSLATDSGTALFWGGCLGGSVIGMLWPQAWLKPPKLGSEPRIPQGSTVLSAPLKATLLLAAFTLSTHGGARINRAQSEAQPAERSSTVGAEWTVLVPVLTGEEPSPVVHVTPSLLAAVQQLRSQPAAPIGYLISSAEYSGRLDDHDPALFEARFRVVLLTSRDTIRVQLPLSGVHLAGRDSGQVDGEPHPIYRAPDGLGLFVDLRQNVNPADGPRVADVSLRFYPAKSSPAGLVDFGIPTVAANQLSLTGAGSRGLVLPGVAIDDSEPTTDEQAVSFGRLNRLELKPAGSSASAGSSELTARISQHAEIRPLGISYRIHAAYRVVRGEPDFVNWRLPPGVVVRNIESERLVGHSVTALADGHSLVRIELSTPHGDDFSLDADLFMALPQAQDSVSVPTLALVENDRRTPGNVTVALNQLGVSTTSEFELSPLTPDDESLTSISADSFVRAAGATRALGEPQFAYRVFAPADRVFHIAARVPNRRVRATQEATIALDAIDWTMNAEIAIDSAAAFQHVLLVDTRLRIRAVSVREDGAERLARWWRDGNRVVLFLKDKTAGVQNVVLQGRLPTHVSALQPLPVIGFENAEVTESTLLLNRRPGVEVQVFDSDSQPRDQDPAPPASDDRLVALARLAIRPGADQPRVRIEQSTASPSLETFTSLSRDNSDAIWNFRQKLVLRDVSENIAPLRVSIPPELATGYDIQGFDGKPLYEVGPDGAVEVALDRSKFRELISVTVSGALTEPNLDDWELPSTNVADFRAPRNFLAMDDVSTWQPLDAKPLAASSGPDGFEDFLTNLDPNLLWKLFASDPSDWVLTRAQVDALPTESSIPVMHTQLWIGSDAGTFDYGRTEIRTDSPFQTELTLVWPQDTQIRAALVDGIPVAFESSADDRLRISGEKLSNDGSLVVYWSQQPAASISRWGTWSRELPSPLDTRVAEAWTTLIPPLHRQLSVDEDPEVVPSASQSPSTSEGQLVARGMPAGRRDRHLILAQTSRPTLAGWAYSDRLTYWGFTIAGIPILFVCLQGLLKIEGFRRLNKHDGLALGLIGLVWWLFLSWSAVGFATIVGAGLLTFYQAGRRPLNDDDFIEVAASPQADPQLR